MEKALKIIKVLSNINQTTNTKTELYCNVIYHAHRDYWFKIVVYQHCLDLFG
jgi:hypothetical protein